MDIQIRKSVRRTVLCCYLMFALSGCFNVGTLHETRVRSEAAEVATQLSPGDTRQKVRSVLGEPLIDARDWRLEVYKKQGTDIDWGLYGTPIPVPVPGNQFILDVMVVYDKYDVVTEIAVATWDNGAGVWRLNAGDFSLIRHGGFSSATILGPPTSWDELAAAMPRPGTCSLILVMDRCPMPYIHLDKKLLGRPDPEFQVCAADPERDGLSTYHELVGTILWSEIGPGDHLLRVSTLHGDPIKATFRCELGESIYAKLENYRRLTSKQGSEYSIQATIEITKSTPKNIEEQGEIRPILWDQGRWYGAPSPTH